jgi:hypothetical protein
MDKNCNGLSIVSCYMPIRSREIPQHNSGSFIGIDLASEAHQAARLLRVHNSMFDQLV